jgi:hypothetical protein
MGLATPRLLLAEDLAMELDTLIPASRGWVAVLGGTAGGHSGATRRGATRCGRRARSHRSETAPHGVATFGLAIGGDLWPCHRAELVQSNG